MTVGILGMAFKGESDDIRSSPVLQAQADPGVPRRRRARAPTRTSPSTRRCVPLETVLEQSDILILAAPHSDLPRPPDRQAGRRRVELPGPGQHAVSLAVSVVIPAYQEGDAIIPVLDRLFDAIELECEVLVVVDFEDDSTVPVLAAVRRRRSRGCAPWSTPTAVARRTRSATASTTPAHSAVVVTMADGSDDPRQIDDLARLIDRGVVVAAASRYSPGGQQVGGPMVKGLLSRTAGLSLQPPGAASAPMTRPTASRPTRPTSSARSASTATTGFEIGLELTAKARRLRRPVAEIAHHLARPDGR